jgi:SnoaL-like protein
MTRTPQEIFGHYGKALMDGDLDEIMADYGPDSVFITPAGILRGKGQIRQAFSEILADLPNATWEVPTQIFEGDALLIEWTAGSSPHRRAVVVPACANSNSAPVRRRRRPGWIGRRVPGRARSR